MTISGSQRASLFAFSAACYVVVFLTEGSGAPAQGATSILPTSALAPATLISLRDLIRRDPFGAKPVPVSSLAPAAALGGLDAVPPGLVVPDIAAAPDESASSSPRALRLKATIVGHPPVAYVDDGATMTVVRIGDTLGGRRIVRIDLDAITFADGARLTLEERAATTPPVPPVRHAHRAVARRAAGSASSAAATSSPSAPIPSVAPASPAFPTPGVLPTIKPGPFPVGSRPTSDPAAPTAYPYPYPYAPH